MHRVALGRVSGDRHLNSAPVGCKGHGFADPLVVGQRVAEIGPLPVRSDTEYTAVYLEGIFDPGMTAAIHTHSGPEAFYTLTGETCLETPDGVLTGNVVIVPGGPPMLLTATGAVRRRGVVLILHDSSQPATTLVHDWTPKGLCPR